MPTLYKMELYTFDHHHPHEDGLRELLGGKGYGLYEMARLGLPVPPGFTIPSRCEALHDTQWQHVLDLLKKTFPRFGSSEDPELVSCRSGAAVSMPGMMDTVLSIGLCNANLEAFAKHCGATFAIDTYCRLIKGFSVVVHGVPEHAFPRRYDDVKVFLEVAGDRFPQEPFEQIRQSVHAVFGSWKNERAVEYRRNFNIPEHMGTACNIQRMVFGNRNDQSGTGVCFTRNPSTGEPTMYGEYLQNAQGEDVVSGDAQGIDVNAMEPAVHSRLKELCLTLERHFGDAQDIEFTVEDGDLYLLQTRAAKRTPAAKFRIAHDLFLEGMIDEKAVLERVSAADLDALMRPSFRACDLEKNNSVAQGTGASPGAAVGRVAKSVAKAKEFAERGHKVILVREFTKPDDVPAFFVSEGVLTFTGGPTSHAAVVARQMGLPCVVGSSGNMDLLEEGEVISVDGATGLTFRGALERVEPNGVGSSAVQEIMKICDKVLEDARFEVWANADNAQDAKVALSFNAKGIGLCRSEHQFFEPERLALFRTVLRDPTDRDALARVEAFQQADFEELLETMAGLPVTIRLLDPPLHEFLPDDETLREENPMLGLRGVRLGLMRPELYDMQVRAIGKAHSALLARNINSKPKIMVPFVSYAKELQIVRERFIAVLKDLDVEVQYVDGEDRPHTIEIGTMIETPRACLTIEEIDEYASFYSVGSNDLTQMMIGISRDDAQKSYLTAYETELGILQTNPFSVIDRKIARMIAENARKTGASFGLCGEHGGDPASIQILIEEFTRDFQRNATLDYVSCSPYRVLGARLSAAKAFVSL